MADYYSFLAQKISEAEDDPVKLRQFIYEAAGFALKRHINASFPDLSWEEGDRMLADFAAAVDRLERENGGMVGTGRAILSKIGGGPVGERELYQKTEDAGDGRSSANKRAAFGAATETARPPPNLNRSADDSAQGGADERKGNATAQSRLFSNRTARFRTSETRSGRRDDRSGAEAARVGAVRFGDWGQERHGLAKWNLGSISLPLLISVGAVCQLVVVALAGAAFYLSTRQHPAPLPPSVSSSVSPPQASASSALAPRIDSSRPPEIASSAVPPKASQAEASIAPATESSASVASSSAFPRPKSYGVYMISDDQLIELEQVEAVPADPKGHTNLQIKTPSRTVLSNPRPRFIAYRRELAKDAPDLVPVRIAAKVSSLMTFDGTGTAKTAPPETATWLVRDRGFNLRVAPVQDSREMLLLWPTDDITAFPPGRYELAIAGSLYDFVIEGKVTDPAQCMESFMTAQGRGFYECKAP